MEYDLDIFDAVEFGDLETVESFWTNQININWQDLNGMNLTMTACQFENKDILIHLLSYKPDLTQKNSKGQTALDIAKELRNENLIDILNRTL